MQPYSQSRETGDGQSPVIDIESGVYVLGKVVVVVARGNPLYLASRPPMNLRLNPVLAGNLKQPTPKQKQALLRNPDTFQWLTGQVGRSPEVRKAINDFLD